MSFYRTTINGQEREPTPEEKIRFARRLEEMFASGEAPQLRTDSTFWSALQMGRQFTGKDADQGDFYKKRAKKAGVDTTGKLYMSQLAAFPGDPKAWVSDRHDVQKVCEERNWSCEGAVNTKASVYREENAPKLKPTLEEATKIRQKLAKKGKLKRQNRWAKD